VFVCNIISYSVIVSLSTTLTATQLITERKEGVIDRTWVAGTVCFCALVLLIDAIMKDEDKCYRTLSIFLVGVNIMEIVLSQTISFFIMLCVQLTPLFFLIVYAFDVSLFFELLK